jgi:hypothetical protein
MTNEHVWGNWLKPHVRGITNKHFLHQRIVGKQGTRDRHALQIRAGASPLHSKVAIVCTDCNSSWLSRIQENAKPHLLPLLEGKTNIVIGATAQKAIATWATMATITGEFIHRRLSSIAISNEARETFKDTRAPFVSGPLGCRLGVSEGMKAAATEASTFSRHLSHARAVRIYEFTA